MHSNRHVTQTHHSTNTTVIFEPSAQADMTDNTVNDNTILICSSSSSNVDIIQSQQSNTICTLQTPELSKVPIQITPPTVSFKIHNQLIMRASRKRHSLPNNTFSNTGFVFNTPLAPLPPILPKPKKNVCNQMLPPPPPVDMTMAPPLCKRRFSQRIAVRRMTVDERPIPKERNITRNKQKLPNLQQNDGNTIIVGKQIGSISFNLFTFSQTKW